jgi:hypothetical protein
MADGDTLMSNPQVIRVRELGGQVLARVSTHARAQRSTAHSLSTNCSIVRLTPPLPQRRPWSKLLDTGALSKPHNLVDVNARLRSNLSEYSANYALLVVAVVSLALLTHPGSLVVVALLGAGWVSLLTRDDAPVVVHGRPVTRQEQIAAGAVVSLGAACCCRARFASNAPNARVLAAVVLLFTQVAALLASALSIATAGVVAHAALHSPNGADGVDSGGNTDDGAV